MCKSTKDCWVQTREIAARLSECIECTECDIGTRVVCSSGNEDVEIRMGVHSLHEGFRANLSHDAGGLTDVVFG